MHLQLSLAEIPPRAKCGSASCQALKLPACRFASDCCQTARRIMGGAEDGDLHLWASTSEEDDIEAERRQGKNRAGSGGINKVPNVTGQTQVWTYTTASNGQNACVHLSCSCNALGGVTSSQTKYPTSDRAEGVCYIDSHLRPRLRTSRLNAERVVDRLVLQINRSPGLQQATLFICTFEDVSLSGGLTYLSLSCLRAQGAAHSANFENKGHPAEKSANVKRSSNRASVREEGGNTTRAQPVSQAEGRRNRMTGSNKRSSVQPSQGGQRRGNVVKAPTLPAGDKGNYSRRGTTPGKTMEPSTTTSFNAEIRGLFERVTKVRLPLV